MTQAPRNRTQTRTNPAPLTLRRVLPPAQLPTYFRFSVRDGKPKAPMAVSVLDVAAAFPGGSRSKKGGLSS